MKKIIALALALVMTMALLTACGVTLVAPEGTYSSESGTYTAVFGPYDADANSGTLTITRVLMDMPESVSGTYAVFQNGDEETTFIIDFTPDGGETIENFMVYGVDDDVIAQYSDVGDIGGNNTSYYAVVEDAAE